MVARVGIDKQGVEDRPCDASLLARSQLMARLAELIRYRGWTQKEAASRLGVTQPRISDLMRGKAELFSLDALVDMAALAGLQPHIVLQARNGAANAEMA